MQGNSFDHVFLVVLAFLSALQAGEPSLEPRFGSVKARTMTYRLLSTIRKPGIAINAPLKVAQRTPDLDFYPKALEGRASHIPRCG